MAVVNTNVPIDDVMKMADWPHISTFQKFYYTLVFKTNYSNFVLKYFPLGFKWSWSIIITVDVAVTMLLFFYLTMPSPSEISVSPGNRRKSPARRPWHAGYSDPNKK